MSGYSTSIGQYMPYVIDVTAKDAARLVERLMQPGYAPHQDGRHVAGMQDGSSFAVTTEPGFNKRRIYLSVNSFKRLQPGGDLDYVRLTSITDLTPREPSPDVIDGEIVE